MRKFLLDTNAIIQAINEDLILPKNRYLMSIITEIELFSYGNLTKNDEINLKRLLNNFEIIELNSCIKEEAIKIRKNSKIKLPDCIIMATAITKNAILVTSDKQLLNSKFINSISLEEIINE